MKYFGFYSAEMDDLLIAQQRINLTSFADSFFQAITNQSYTSINYAPVIPHLWSYAPKTPLQKKNAGEKKVVILTDVSGAQENLTAMIDRVKHSFETEAEVINLHTIDIKGGCLECYRCGYNYQCVYANKDQFIEMYQTKLKTADILIFAGAIQDRYLSSKWKLFFDRGFFNSHTPSFAGKQIGFLISGPLRQNPNLRQIIESYVHWQQANLVEVVTDEYDDAAYIDGLLDGLVVNSIKFAEQRYIKPMSFLGVGGLKIFRDDIWGKLQFIWQADHRYYKKHGIYNFPQQDYRTRIKNFFLISLMKIPGFRREFYKIAQDKAIEAFQKFVKA